MRGICVARAIPCLQGAALTLVVACSEPVAPAAPPTLVNQWGTQGSQDGTTPGEFYSPRAIGVDDVGNVYVADLDGDVQKFDADGRYLLSFSFRREGILYGRPVGLSIDASGNVYVAQALVSANSSGLGRVQRFTADGEFIVAWEFGPGEGYYYDVEDVAVDSNGNTYVADFYGRIHKFDSDGRLLLEWGSQGRGDGEFGMIAGLATDSAGNLYTADQWRGRIQVFDGEGRFLSKRDVGNRQGMRGIAVAATGDVYITDTIFDRILRFDATGRLLLTWGQPGQRDSEFDHPVRIALSADGAFIYVLDLGNHRVQKFAR